MTEHSPSADTCDLPTREDVQELRQAVESLRDHVQIVWQAIDEVREVIDRGLGPDSPDGWTVEPSQGFGLGRYRPFAGYDPFDEWNTNKKGSYEPRPVLSTSTADGALETTTPVDVSNHVPSAVPVRLREFQDQEGMNSLADQPPQDGRTVDEVPESFPPLSEPKSQQSLWKHDPLRTSGIQVTAAPEAAPGPEQTPQKEAEPADSAAVYTLDDWIAFRHAFSDGEIDAVGIRAEFVRMKAGREHFIHELVKLKSADQLRLMALQAGSYDARRNTKKQNAESIYRTHLTAFTLGDTVRYSPMQETYEDAVTRIVMALTDESIAERREKNRQEREAREKALTNPETHAELSQFVSRKGTDQLSDEQLVVWDRLNADISRNARKQKQKASVEQFQSEEIAQIEFRIIEGFHDREQVPLWIVQLTSRVERAAFNELKIKAGQLGGWWSSFKKNAAGFQFRSQESANKFAGLACGDADRSDELLARKLRKMDTAAERLDAVATSLEEKAAEVLAADDHKLKNTMRRADMAASMRAQAYTDQADAKTLRSIAAALAAGDAQYLDGVWNAAQVRTLVTILRQARRERINRRLQEEGTDRRMHGWSQRYDELEAEPLTAADARYAVFPKPYLYRQHLVQAFAQLGNTPGVKKATAKMQKLVNCRKDQDFVDFVNDHEVELLEDFLARAKNAGSKIWWFDHCLDSFKRLRSAHIYDNHELRTALRELVPHIARAAGDDPVTRAEDELRGKDLAGFFPTPRQVIERMLDLAGIEQTHRVLEPSCGKGDILDAIRREHPDVDLSAVEQNFRLQGVLTAKGYGEIVTYRDFLDHKGEYDRIVMNPPFENGQDSDHVRHAYDLLAPGGRLVSVMCEGPFFRSDAKSAAFRDWLCRLDNAHDEELPDDAFKGVEAFRQTSVKTRLVILNKP
jgi:hypothetical protein